MSQIKVGDRVRVVQDGVSWGWGTVEAVYHRGGIVVRRLARIGDSILVPRMRMDAGKWDYEKATIMDLTETTMYLQDGTYILRGEYPLVDNSGYVR